jgi:hypothetical protein
MADQLYLSYRLLGYTEGNMVRHFEKMLKAFPFSKLSRSPRTLRINAVSFTEPVLFEDALLPTADLAAILKLVREYQGADCATTLDAYWDLWQYEADWKLAPSRVSLVCLGPAFENDAGDHLRIDLGVDAAFLPDPELPNSAFMAQSNIRSLLTLVQSLDSELNVERRRLWTETGENFADKLAELAGVAHQD